MRTFVMARVIKVTFFEISEERIGEEDWRKENREQSVGKSGMEEAMSSQPE